MEKKFIVSCESAIDLNYKHCQERDIKIIYYNLVIDGKEYVDNMFRDKKFDEFFHKSIQDGVVPQTSQINQYTYEEFFKQFGDTPVLHLTLSTGITKTYNNAVAAAKNVGEHIKVIDSTCICVGYGMLVDYVCDIRDKGCNIQEAYDWTQKHKRCIHHEFIAEDLSHLQRCGRLSGPTANLAKILNIIPVMTVNREGELYAYSKVRGIKKAIKAMVDRMERTADGGLDYDGRVCICAAYAEHLNKGISEEVLKRFPKVKNVECFKVGNIITSHCGIGTASLFFMGSERDSGKK